MKFVLELCISSVRFKTKMHSGLYEVTFTELNDNYLEIHTVYGNWHQHLYQDNRRDHFD